MVAILELCMSLATEQRLFIANVEHMCPLLKHKAVWTNVSTGLEMSYPPTCTLSGQ